MRRFNALGKLILSLRPDTIIQGGDFVTLDSFSRWDRDKRLKIEGRRYAKDVGVGVAAIYEMTSPIRYYNERRRLNKERQYQPNWVWFQGNHEHWADAYVERNPEVEGMINIQKDLHLEMLPGTVDYVPYVTEDWYRTIEGVSFCHIPRNRIGPISSKYIAEKALDVFDNSVVFGHTHRLTTSSLHRSGADRIYRSINGGCFFDKDPAYAVGNCNDYWRGVLALTVDCGEIAVTEIPMGDLV